MSFRDQRFLIDCGEGTQRQILKSGVGFRRLNRVLITHGHLDHILGLAGLVSTFARWEAIGAMEIYAGGWALERIRDLLFGVVLRGARPPMDIHLIPVQPGILIEEQEMSVTAFPVKHRGPDAFGYAFQEASRRPFLAKEADRLGIPPGPERGTLVDGHPVTLSDGRRIEPDQVLGPARTGARLVHIGDCGDTESLLEVSKNADGLVIEATYLEYEHDLAQRFGHLTARQAAELAQRARVAHLYLTHISRRYREREIHEEAKSVFPEVTVARDFDRFEIRRSEPAPDKG